MPPTIIIPADPINGTDEWIFDLFHLSLIPVENIKVFFFIIIIYTNHSCRRFLKEMSAINNANCSFNRTNKRWFVTSSSSTSSRLLE